MQQEPITPPRTTRSASAGLQANQNSSQGPLGTSEAKEDSLHTSGTPYFRCSRTCCACLSHACGHVRVSCSVPYMPCRMSVSLGIYVEPLSPVCNAGQQERPSTATDLSPAEQTRPGSRATPCWTGPRQQMSPTGIPRPGRRAAAPTTTCCAQSSWASTGWTRPRSSAAGARCTGGHSLNLPASAHLHGI